MKTLPEKIRSAIFPAYDTSAMYEMLGKLEDELGVETCVAPESFALCLEAIATEIEKSYTPTTFGLGADGEPIKAMDDLWVADFENASVTGIDQAKKVLICGYKRTYTMPIQILYTTKDGYVLVGYAKAEALTHTKPYLNCDSLQIFNDDLQAFVEEVSERLDKFSDRLHKLIKASNHEG